jgi:hypothetical protein
MRNHTTLAPLACLALAIRNVAARMMADADPSGYDHATATGECGLDSAPDAYTAIGPDGWGLFGAFGDAGQDGTADELTGATGFLPDGELPGFGTDEYRAAEWQARQAAEGERIDALVAKWGLSERKALEYLGTDAGPDVDTAGACWSTSEGLADTTELSDDTDRYAHLADAHVVESRQLERAAARGTAEGRKAGPVVKREATWAELAAERNARFARLGEWLHGQLKATLSRKTRALAERNIRAARAKWRALYVASVQACLAKPDDEGRFTTIYLTRSQAERLGAMPPKAPKAARRA